MDLFDLYECFSADAAGSAAVFEHWPGEPYDTPKDAHDWLTGAEAEWEDQEAAKYAAYEDDSTLVGSAALDLDWERQTGTLGVILARPYWGNGYACECAVALTELAFGRLDLELVVLGYEEGNDRSKRTIEKVTERLGGQYDGIIRNATPREDGVVDAHRYTITEEQYETNGER